MVLKGKKIDKTAGLWYNLDMRGIVMDYQLKSVALHITNECSSKCPMCYYTKDGQIKCEGNLETLKQIGVELRNAGVEEIILVGGDPAEYSKIQELVEFYHRLGFRIPILSNTHRYKNTTVERITPFVTSLEATFHGTTSEEHDNFNRTPGSYNMIIENLKKYAKEKTEDQQLGGVLNVMNYNYDRLYEIIDHVLAQGLPLDYVLIQRIGLYGKAENEMKYAIVKEKLAKAFEQVDRINKELGVESVMVDAFPLCLIPKEYHQYLGSCDWGKGTASMDMNGNISRCAVAEHCGQNLLGNILETPITEIWQNHPTLVHFRSKDYLREECKQCDLLTKCGGGCPMSCGNNELSSDLLVKSLKR